MRGYLTLEEELRVATILVDGPQPVTPPEYVRDYTELHLQGLVWTNSSKRVRLTRIGVKKAQAICKEHKL